MVHRLAGGDGTRELWLKTVNLRYMGGKEERAVCEVVQNIAYWANPENPWRSQGQRTALGTTYVGAAGSGKISQQPKPFQLQVRE